MSELVKSQIAKISPLVIATRHSFVHKTCLFEAGACLSAPDAETTTKNAIVSTYTIKIKEIMVVSVHCRH